MSPPLLATVDVCVVGSGPAGSTAAIAAARGGARVLLIEKLPFLGGTSTAALDTFYGFYPPPARPPQGLAGPGARPLPHAFLEDAEVRDGIVETITVATKSGLRSVRARVFIDASGDADLCRFAGFAAERAGELEPAQTLTTTFRLANVDGGGRGGGGARDPQAAPARPPARPPARGPAPNARPRREGSDPVPPVSGMPPTIMPRLESTAARGGE